MKMGKMWDVFYQFGNYVGKAVRGAVDGVKLALGMTVVKKRTSEELSKIFSDGDKKEEPKTPSNPQVQKPKAKLDPKKTSEPTKEATPKLRPVKKAVAPAEDLEKQRENYDKIYAKVKELSNKVSNFPEVSEEDRGGHKWIIIWEWWDVPISITVTKTGLINMRVEPLKHETEFYYLVEEIDLEWCMDRISNIPDMLSGKEPSSDLFNKENLKVDLSEYWY